MHCLLLWNSLSRQCVGLNRFGQEVGVNGSKQVVPTEMSGLSQKSERIIGKVHFSSLRVSFWNFGPCAVRCFPVNLVMRKIICFKVWRFSKYCARSLVTSLPQTWNHGRGWVQSCGFKLMPIFFLEQPGGLCCAWWRCVRWACCWSCCCSRCSSCCCSYCCVCPSRCSCFCGERRFCCGGELFWFSCKLKSSGSRVCHRCWCWRRSSSCCCCCR